MTFSDVIPRDYLFYTDCDAIKYECEGLVQVLGIILPFLFRKTRLVFLLKIVSRTETILLRKFGLSETTQRERCWIHGVRKR